MSNYEIEKQIRQMLDKYQQSDFTQRETRRCIAEIISHKIKEHIDEVYSPNNRNRAEMCSRGKN